MFSLVKIYFAGMLISFLGSLPLGTLNITAMQIAIQETLKRSLLYALGVAIVEILYVRLSLKGIDWILSNQKVFYILEWITVGLFLLLAASSFWTARKKNSTQKHILLNNRVNRFLLGLGMSAMNPVQLPFWFLWSSYLFSTGILESSTISFNVYTLGIGTGTIIGLLFFILGGKWLVRKLNTGQRTINILVGLVFLITAIIQLSRVVSKPMEQRLKSGFNQQLPPGKNNILKA